MRSERRRSRDSLTRSLERIAGRIAQAPSQTVEWNDRHRYTREVSTITAKRLWVAGSYARGAPQCGDLDLVLEVTVSGVHPSSRTIAKGLFGSAPDTTLYVGTPDENSSYVVFPEACLIWSEDSPDWKANISAIACDAGAGRYARPTDRLPLRPEQMSTTLEELEQLLQLKGAQVLDWKFVDASDITLDPAAVESTRLLAECLGAKTRDALQLAASYFGAAGREGEWNPATMNERTRFRCGGILLLTAYPEIPVHHLENPFYDTLALVPHRSRRGPNGIWIIRRGPAHLVEKLFADCRAFYVTCNGEPLRISDVSYSTFNPATGIDLFSDEQDAFDVAENERDFFGDDDEIEVASAGGSELLRLIAGCDLVLVDHSEELVLTRAGQLARQSDEDEEVRIADAPALAAALTGIPPQPAESQRTNSANSVDSV
jgi:hypothetical protein